MIIFDLDGTLADCEHRRHFVDPLKDQSSRGYIQKITCGCPFPHTNDPWINRETGEKWEPDWRAFYDACGDDKPILPVINIFKSFLDSTSVEGCRSECFDIEIWSGRCESVRNKTEKWLAENVWGAPFKLKMRPQGNTEPDEVLKERWLEETYEETKWGRKSSIQFVFDDRPKVVRMWQRHGIFVFNCAQHDNEF